MVFFITYKISPFFVKHFIWFLLFFYFSTGDLRSGACCPEPTNTAAGATRPRQCQGILSIQAAKNRKNIFRISEMISFYFRQADLRFSGRRKIRITDP
jgi:hypothetical protein